MSLAYVEVVQTSIPLVSVLRVSVSFLCANGVVGGGDNFEGNATRTPRISSFIELLKARKHHTPMFRPHSIVRTLGWNRLGCFPTV